MSNDAAAHGCLTDMAHADQCPHRAFTSLSAATWRLADLGAKHSFLKAGLGWGHMPMHMVEADIASGALVRIRIEGFARETAMPMRAVYRKDAPPGPAARTFLSQVKEAL